MEALHTALSSDIRILRVIDHDGIPVDCRHNLTDAHLATLQKVAKKHHALDFPSVDGARITWESGKYCGVFRFQGWWFSGWYSNTQRQYLCIDNRGLPRTAPSIKEALAYGDAGGFESLHPALVNSLSYVL